MLQDTSVQSLGKRQAESLIRLSIFFYNSLFVEIRLLKFAPMI